MSIDITIPALGESVSEGVIARWVKRDGDTVAVDDVLFELETDKATMEIPSTAAGRLEIVAPEGSTVAVGAVVARIAEGATAGRPAPAGANARAEGERGAAPPARASTATHAAGGGRDATPAQGSATAAQASAAGAASVESASSRREASSSAESAAPAKSGERAPTSHGDDSGRRGSPSGSGAHAEPEPAAGGDGDRSGPAVRRLLAEHRLDPAEIAGTGKGGRITKEDVANRLAEAKAATAAPPAAPQAPPVAAPRPATAARPAATRDESDRREPMSRLRQRIAERLVEAQRTAAILTTFNEIDCSAIMDARRRHRERFKQAHGVDLGLMSLFSRAAIMALGDVPVVNARIEGTEIVHPAHVHLGVAVGTERGLVVPVVRRAETMSLADLERAIGEVATRAREGRLVPDDLAGGTFSITNGGVYGSLLSTPILNPPQSGILGMHKIEERPIAVNGQVVIRPMMYVALSYDHRLVDGQQAVTFLVRVKERLEDPVRMLLAV